MLAITSASKYPIKLETFKSKKYFNVYLPIISIIYAASLEYGFEKNLRVYGSFTPPEYPLQNIESAVYLWASEHDFLNTIKVSKLFLYMHLLNFLPVNLFPILNILRMHKK